MTRSSNSVPKRAWSACAGRCRECAGTRYRLAALKTGARTLLRVTGDAPLIDPGLIDYLVSGLRLRTGADFVQFEAEVHALFCAHEGVDVFSRQALDWLTTHVAQTQLQYPRTCHQLSQAAS